ncbi:HTH domain-containing protein [Halopiger djelfimassiliensis]|uniref:HTH domain-containing protein n=1 Tax=Halopiger djelfimassiliensis TaxID=1293047 RepID=UPI0006777CD4|nr:HTH domain-containing protein [Halopiger djelfimassiliensis]
MSDASPELTVVCHVRAPLLLEPIDSQIETLQVCESEGTIDDLLIRSWPKEVSRSDSSPHQEVRERYDRFLDWADRHGVSIRPPFRERTRTSQVTGETTELLVTPLLCLELYRDDELVGVFPHTDGETTYTTDEAIAKLRTGEFPTPLEGETKAETSVQATSAPSNGCSCPDCGNDLIDGQGTFACPDCGWVGTVTESGQFVSRPKRTELGDTEADEKPGVSTTKPQL